MVYIDELEGSSASSSSSSSSSSHQTGVVPVMCAKHPPCRVCGGRGSGIHYGVNSCEACKGFFRRQYSRASSLLCKKQGVCPILSGHRMCAPCRMRKCLHVGMSYSGIRIGRSSYIQVTAAIEEVKKLELQYKLRGDGSLVSQKEHLMRVDDIISKLTDTHLTVVPNTNDFMIEVKQQEQLYMEQKALEEQTYGKRRMLQRSEYNEIYKQTELDVDGRREILQSFGPMIYKAIQIMSVFVRRIPGYTKMSRNDQNLLMCAGSDVAYSFLNMCMFNIDHGLYVCPLDTSLIISLDVLYGFEDTHTGAYDLLFDLLHQCQRLELTAEEQTVAAALTFMLADVELSPVGKRLQHDSAEYLSEILYNLTQKNHSPEEHTFAKLMSVYVRMMDIMPKQQADHRNMMQDMQDMNLPKEWFDLTLDPTTHLK